MTIVKTTKGPQFKLLKTSIREISRFPWVAERADIKAAFQGKLRLIPTGVGPEPFTYPLSRFRFVARRGFVQIGCMQFVGTQAIKLRNWANAK